MTEKRNILLRAVEPSDLDCLYIWENDPQVWQFGYAPAPLSRHRLWDYISNYQANPMVEGQLRLIVEADGEAVGSIDLYEVDAHNGHAFMGIMIAPGHRRRGYAFAAVEKMLGYCRHNLALTQVCVYVAADNSASLALFRKAGFRMLARLEKWVRRSAGTYADAIMLTRML